MARPGRLPPIGHLVRRFCGSLWSGGPSSAAEDRVAGLLGDGELGLWRRMSGADRRHSVVVARRVESVLGGPEGPDLAAAAGDGGTPLLAAALLHDVGKVRSGLGTFGRVAATVLGAAVPGRARGWSGRGGLRGRVGPYPRRPAEGAALLYEAGGDPRTGAWALEHQRRTEWKSGERRLAEVRDAGGGD